MSFLTKMWKNRSVEYPNRFTIKAVDEENGIYDITRLEGKVSEEGDALDAENFNNQEDRIGEAFDEVYRKADENYSDLVKTMDDMDRVLNDRISETNSSGINRIQNEEMDRRKADGDIENQLADTRNELMKEIVSLENRVAKLEKK